MEVHIAFQTRKVIQWLIIPILEINSSQRHKQKGSIQVNDRNQGSGQKQQIDSIIKNSYRKNQANQQQSREIAPKQSGRDQQEEEVQQNKVPRKQLLLQFNPEVDIVACSNRVDQRIEKQNTVLIEEAKQEIQFVKEDEEQKVPLNSNSLNQDLTNALDLQYENKLKHSIVINSRQLVSERRNPIEINYEILEVIGTGGFGEVKRVKHKQLDVIRALKIIKKSKYKTPAEIKMIKNEIAIMKLVDHPNIVKLFEFFEDDESFFIITEYCAGGQLFEMIRQKKQFTENEAAQIMEQLFSAIAHCHQRKVVHRDVKPENLLVDVSSSDKDQFTLKIIDFGISTLFDPDQKLTLSIGTPYYVAPEVIERQYNEKCDVWSCGVILYILLCGYPPFAARNQNDIYKKILKGTYSFTSQEWTSVSKAAKDFIKKLLQKHSTKRISAAEALNDPWIKMYTGKQKVHKPICVSALNQLKSFQCERKLEQAVIAYITNSMMNKQTEAKLMQTFKQFDKNNDGILTIDELREGFKEYLGEQILFEEELQQIIRNVDFNQNGMIEYSEFVSATSNLNNLLTEKHLKQAFDLFDLDQNGQITPRELKHILGNKDQELRDEEWEQLINEFDKNGDGMINFQEFKNMMVQLHVKQRQSLSLLQEKTQAIQEQISTIKKEEERAGTVL